MNAPTKKAELNSAAPPKRAQTSSPKKNSANAIQVWDPGTSSWFEEKVLGGQSLKFFYGNPLGRLVARHVLSKSWFSRLCGVYQDTSMSRIGVEEFCREYSIATEEFERGPFSSFNQFFIRAFQPGLRPFPNAAQDMGAPAEARYHTVASLPTDGRIPVKGVQLNPSELLGSPSLGAHFENGPAVIARLCPVDYHRFHFPDHGIVESVHWVSGDLYSVNPIVFDDFPEVFLRNERCVAILNTENFGRLAYVPVGATCVGKIAFHLRPGQRFCRGDEAGYFLFGGSTVVLLGEKGVWVPEPEITDRTLNIKAETYLKLGQILGSTR